MGKKKEYDQYEMPVPEDVKGMHILLIDPDISSLMHTSSMLENATYKVTSTAVPDVALSMMQERVKQYDLVMAAVQMRGMDCLTFLKAAKAVSNIPVALMSYDEDLQLAIRAIQLGACHYFVKPLSRNDIRSLWQFIVRKARDVPRAILSNEAIAGHTNARGVVSLAPKPQDLKGKGKEVTMDAEAILGHENLRRKVTVPDGDGMDADKESRKRKRSNDGSKKKGKNKKKEKCGGRSNKKTVKWNAELHAKFMRVLMMDSAEGAIAGLREQACRGTDVTDLPQTTSHNQISKERLTHPNTNTPVEPSTGQTSVGQQQQLIGAGSSSSEKGLDPKRAENALQISGAPLGLQSQNIAKTCPAVWATNVGLNVADIGKLVSGGRGGYTTGRTSFNSRSQLVGSGGLNLGTQITQMGLAERENSNRVASFLYNTNNRFGVRDTSNKNLEVSQSGGVLMERIDQIRRAYRASSGSGTARTLFNTQASSGGQAQRTNDPRQNQNQANYAISLETIESRMSGRKRNHSQYENFSIGLAASSLELMSKQTDLFRNNMVENISHIGSSTNSMNVGFYPQPNGHQQNPAPTALQFSCASSENYAPSILQNSSNVQIEPTGLVRAPNNPITSPNGSFFGSTEMMFAPTNHAAQFSGATLGSREVPFLNPNPKTAQFLSTLSEASAPSLVQNASNLQMESTGFFQDLDYPLYSANNDGLLNSNNVQTGIGGTNQEPDALQGVPFEAGSANQAEKPTNDFNGQNLGGFASINSREGFQTSAQGSNSEQTPIDDAALDEIFAELRPHFVDGDLGSSGSNINNIR